MAVRYEPSIIYKGYEITPVIHIDVYGIEGPARYVITDADAIEIGDAVDSLGAACRMVDSLSEMLRPDYSVDEYFVDKQHA